MLVHVAPIHGGLRLSGCLRYLASMVVALAGHMLRLVVLGLGALVLGLSARVSGLDDVLNPSSSSRSCFFCVCI